MVSQYPIPPVLMGGGGSLEFDGSSYVDIGITETINKGEDFTLSFWHQYTVDPCWSPGSYGEAAYGSTIATNITVEGDDNYDPGASILFMCGSWTKTQYPYIWIAGPNGNDVRLYGNRSNEPLNEWIYYALIRYQNTLTLYRNGVSLDSVTYEDKFLFKTMSLTLGGNKRNGFKTRFFSGLIDDFCIIRRKALWTTNFTPPTTYLPDSI